MKTTLEKPASNHRAEPTSYVSPEVNIFETQDAYILEADLPGVSKDGLEITVEGNELTIAGRRSKESTDALIFRERSTTDYRRAFELDPAIDGEKVSAKIDQGVVTLTLPKSDRVKPRKIIVN